MNLKYGLIALAGLGISANVSATDTRRQMQLAWKWLIVMAVPMPRW